MELQDTEEKCSEFQKRFLQLKSGYYYGGIEEIKKYLRLDGYSHAEVEALLIYEVEKFKFDNPIKVDVTLMEIGLLRGFSISEEVRGSKIAASSRTDVTKRRKDFLLASTYVEHYHPGGCYSHKDLEDSTRLEKAAKSMGATDRAVLISVAEKIESMGVKKIKEHVALSIKERYLPEERYIPEELLPELQHPRKDHPAETKKPKPGTVCNYIETIQISDKYDDVGVELYQKLCRTKDNPPYDEWVATWLIKCIIKKFHETLEADVLRASFALLNGYELAGTSVEERLDEYLEKSNYLALRYDGEYFCIEDIEDEDNLAKIKEELKDHERVLLKRLITYIKQRPEQAKYIEKLEKYGKLIERDGKKVYTPNEQRLYGGKKKKNKRLKMINKLFKGYNNIDAISLKNTIYKESEKIPKVATCLVISIIACCSFLTIKPKITVATFDKNPYSNLSGIPSCMDYRDSVISHNSTLPAESEEPYLEHLAMDNSED